MRKFEITKKIKSVETVNSFFFKKNLGTMVNNYSTTCSS